MAELVSGAPNPALVAVTAHNREQSKNEQRPRTHLGGISRLAVASKRSIRATVLRAELTRQTKLKRTERKSVQPSALNGFGQTFRRRPPAPSASELT